MTIEQLEAYFNTVKLPQHRIKLNNCTTVVDAERFVKSHLEMIKYNGIDKWFKVYYERLLEFKRIVENK